MKGGSSILFALALWGGVMPANAQVVAPFMEDTPFGQFSDEDMSLFDTARLEALERSPDGTTVDWRNPESAASGTVTPLETERNGERQCRLLRIVNRMGDDVGDSRFWFCKMPDGAWKSAPPRQKRP